MNVKRFVAADMRRALELVKQEMGEDAIILSSKRIKKGVEILTSTDSAYDYARMSSTEAGYQSTYSTENSNLPRANRSYRELDNARDTVCSDDAAMDSDDACSWDKKLKGQATQSQRGLASGKTQQELAAEIERARVKMEAADKIPLSQLEKSQSIDLLRQKSSPRTNAFPNKNSYSSDENIERGKSRVGQDRIEPQVPNELNEDLLREAESGYPRSGELPASRITNIHAPLWSSPYSWTGPQDISNFISYPAVDPRPEAGGFGADDEEEIQDQRLRELKNEITDMREMLHVQLERLATIGETPKAQNTSAISLSFAIKATIQRRLVRMGLTERDAEKIVSPIKVRAGLAEAWADVLASFAHQVPAWGKDVISRGGIYAFVGPSGAGKTSIISKLATRYVLEKGSRGLAIITLDTQSANQQQLVRLGKILDVPVHSVHDRISLTRLLAELCNDHLILVDTPSTQLHGSQNHTVAEILRRLPQVENILVLPANGQSKLLQANVDMFQSLQPIACVLTKLDECLSLGEALGVITENQLSVAYCSRGQNMTNDIELASGHQLITKAVTLLKKDQRATTKSSAKPSSRASSRPSSRTTHEPSSKPATKWMTNQSGRQSLMA